MSHLMLLLFMLAHRIVDLSDHASLLLHIIHLEVRLPILSSFCLASFVLGSLSVYGVVDGCKLLPAVADRLPSFPGLALGAICIFNFWPR